MYSYDDLSFESNTTNATSQYPAFSTTEEDHEGRQEENHSEETRFASTNVITLPKILGMSISNW